MTDEQEQRKAAIDRLKNKRAFGQDLVAYVVVNGFLVLVWALTGQGYSGRLGSWVPGGSVS